jgi:hypothetical protein
MFSYFSLLIEGFFFDNIHVHFLIVGHTHSSIDQYFGVLTGAIKTAQFIASPISMMKLLSISHKLDKIYLRPSVERQISIYYDFKTAITPFLSTKIKVICIYFFYNNNNIKIIYITKLFSIMEYRISLNFPARLVAVPMRNTNFFQQAQIICRHFQTV